ncbi:MAG: ATP-binding protein [Phycisphaerales bacterium JB063]
MKWTVGILLAQVLVTMVLAVVLVEAWRGQAYDALTGRGSVLVTLESLAAPLGVLAGGAATAGTLGLAVLGLRMRGWQRGLGLLYASIQQTTKPENAKPIPIVGNRDVDFLIAAYNNMAGRLSASQRELIGLNKNLQAQVHERTDQWRRAMEQAEQASQAKSAFLATMSHEIRTPLTGVIGTLHALGRSPLDPSQQRITHAGWVSANALLNLINDLLDLSAIEAGKIQLAQRPMALSSVVDEVLAIVEPAIDGKPIKLVSDISPLVSGGYVGDPARLRQVLLNLVNNAIKFTDRGRVTVSITPDPIDHDRVRFSVRDTGIGISDEGMQKLFGAFARTDNDSHLLRGGTGLGLNITMRLVQEMGGRVRVESKSGSGSDFWFSLRLQSCPLPEHRKDAHEPACAEKPAPKRVPTQSATRVLLAEDNPVNRYLITELLEGSGASVTAVANGQAAVDAVTEQAFALIFMDVRMPILDGHGATRKIRAIEAQQDARARSRIVALTANVMDDEIKACFDAGMDACIAKPIDADEIRRELDKAPHLQASSAGVSSVRAHVNADANPRVELGDPPDTDPIDLAEIQKLYPGSPERMTALLQLIDEQFRKFKTDLDGCGSDTPEADVSHLAHTIAGCALQARAGSLAEAAKALEHSPDLGCEEKISRLQDSLDDCIDFLSASFDTSPLERSSNGSAAR